MEIAKRNQKSKTERFFTKLKNLMRNNKDYNARHMLAEHRAAYEKHIRRTEMIYHIHMGGIIK
ncbi:MAG: hypothetical protein FWE91_06870 [Defluviitaleaceae bacterium]|nr:hypothetical protein [Defluviitaleaceae bacterium]MCL2836176.1 hypothetical protein [Defluviitaleaceae bacterium]